ncbi:hypothetical protein ACE83Q_07225 [Dellaglioa sp. P0083]|uniref:hypothetical protein n=1 Tax=Dellaglioa kimchii TaxID=3344667 RepID=UPI0038D3B44C
MAAEIKVNNNDSLTIKYVTSEQLQTFNIIFGNPIKSGLIVNPINQQYQIVPVTINGKKYAYSVYDATNNGKNLYTIELQMMK